MSSSSTCEAQRNSASCTLSLLVTCRSICSTPYAVAASISDKGRPLFVICRKGRRGQQACHQLMAAGLTNVVNVAGGTLACVAAGLPMVRSGSAVMSLERQVRIVAGVLVCVGAAMAFFVHPYWLALAMVIGAGLVISGLTDACGMAIVLARMPWNQVNRTQAQAHTRRSRVKRWLCSVGVRPIRWLARCLSLFLIGLLLILFLGEGPPPVFPLSLHTLVFGMLLLNLVGLLAAWRFECLGAAIALVGILSFYALDLYQNNWSRLPGGWVFPLMLATPALYLLDASMGCKNAPSPDLQGIACRRSSKKLA